MITSSLNTPAEKINSLSTSKLANTNLKREEKSKQGKASQETHTSTQQQASKNT
jgi:hypothetical protein